MENNNQSRSLQSGSGFKGFMSHYGHDGVDKTVSIVALPDRRYVTAGSSTDSFTEKYYATIGLWERDEETGQIENKELRAFGDSDVNDYAYFANQTSDGNYLVVGLSCTYASDGYCISLLSKINSAGEELASKTMESSTSYSSRTSEYWLTFKETKYSDIRLFGNRWWVPTDQRYIVYSQFDSDLNFEWVNILRMSGDIFMQDASLTADEDSFIVGYGDFRSGSGKDGFVTIVDENANTLLNRYIGGSGDEYIRSGIIHAGGSVVLVGSTTSFGLGEKNMLVAKLDAAGDTVVMRHYGGDQEDSGRRIKFTPDGNLLAIGSTTSYGNGESSILLTKIDYDTLLPIWSKAIGGLEADEGFALDVEDSGAIIIVGTSKNSYAGPDHETSLIARLSQSGKVYECNDMVVDIDLDSEEITNFVNFVFNYEYAGSGGLTWTDRSGVSSGIAYEDEDIVCEGASTSTLEPTTVVFPETTVPVPTTAIQSTAAKTTPPRTTGQQTTPLLTTRAATTAVPSTVAKTIPLQTTRQQTTRLQTTQFESPAATTLMVPATAVTSISTSATTLNTPIEITSVAATTLGTVGSPTVPLSDTVAATTSFDERVFPTTTTPVLIPGLLTTLLQTTTTAPLTGLFTEVVVMGLIAGGTVLGITAIVAIAFCVHKSRTEKATPDDDASELSGQGRFSLHSQSIRSISIGSLSSLSGANRFQQVDSEWGEDDSLSTGSISSLSEISVLSDQGRDDPRLGGERHDDHDALGFI